MKKTLVKYIPFILICLISLTIRFYQIGQVPNGISPDEADIGYNAYSILKTGKSIYGETLPLFFRSFDGYVGGFAVYSLVPTIAIYGLSDFSIRLMPAIFGLLATIAVYLLMKFLYPKDKYIAYISGFAFALSPWAVEISRAAFGHIDTVLFYILFLLFLILAISKQRKFLLVSALILGLTPYIYSAAIIYLPLMLIIVAIVYKKELIKNLLITVFSIAILLLVSFPAFKFYFSTNARSRFTSISVLTPDVALPISISEMNYDLDNSLPLSNIAHNRRLVYLDDLASNYLKYLNLDYLFVNAKDVRYFYINNVGLFYLIELPFFLSGLYWMIKRRANSDLLILGILIIGPIPAIITLGTAYPHRALLMLLAIQLISAVGISKDFELFFKLKGRNKLPHLAILGLVLFYALNVIFYLHQYFVHTPQEFTSETDNGAWFSTVRDAIPFVNQNGGSYKKIVFTWAQPKLVPASYFLFYNKIDPERMQASISTHAKTSASYQTIYSKLDNIEFRPINWQEDKNLDDTLLIGYLGDFPPGISSVVGKTYEPNGNAHFLFVSTQPSKSIK